MRALLLWLLILPGITLANTERSDRELLQAYDAIMQMWSLSQDYAQGAAVPRDLVLSYAWLSLYAESLPANYPGIQATLTHAREALNEEQMAEAMVQANGLRQYYQFDYHLSEPDLERAFFLKDNKATVAMGDVDEDIADFEDLVEALREQGKDPLADELELRMTNALAVVEKQPKKHVIYGRVLVDGHTKPQNITSPVAILDEGYFVAVLHRPKEKIRFSLPGFEAVAVGKPMTSADDKISNVGLVTLAPMAEEHLATIVGQLRLTGDLKSTRVVLHPLPGDTPKQDADAEQRDVWWVPPAHVIVLGNGQFYAKNLTPARYRLTIAREGHVYSEQMLSLKPGQLLDLGELVA